MKLITAVYSFFIAILAIGSITLTFLDISNAIDLSTSPFFWIDNTILLIFAVDYIIRLIHAKDKRYFFKHNICDLIAVIPFSSLFSIFRIARIFRLFKFARLTKTFRFVRTAAFFSVLWKKVKDILKTNGFIYVLYTSAVLILISSVIMMFVEHQSFEDALWWSIVTCTTVGYGDISPETGVGRIIAVILMLFGIGLIGMLTSAITTYFTAPKRENAVIHDELQNLIDTMSQEELEKLTEIAKILKK